VQAVNDLADAIEQGQGTRAIQQLLTFMKYYAEWHFNHEESVAEAHRCPVAEVNRRAHLQFVQMFQNWQQRYRASQADDRVALEIHRHLADWLVGHIMRVDKHIGDHVCLQKCQPVPSGH
jgi:hemerythrin-like metal-binding domain